MPSCFSLTRKHGPNTKEPESLITVDEAICSFMSLPCDPDKWCEGWYGFIGFRLALGQDFGKIEAELVEIKNKCESIQSREHYQRLQDINAFLSREYTSDAWREFKL